MPFQPGKSGNPSGRPRGAKDKTPRTFRRLARAFMEGHEADIAAALARGVKSKDAHRYLAILASLEKQHVELEMPEPVIVRFVDAAA